MATTTVSVPEGQVTPAVVASTLVSGYNIPTSIVNQKLLSTTAVASDCFTKQAFSNILQMFLINYVVSTSGYYSIYVL